MRIRTRTCRLLTIFGSFRILHGGVAELSVGCAPCSRRKEMWVHKPNLSETQCLQLFRPATDDCHIWSHAYPWGWPCDCHLFIDGTIPVQDEDPASVGGITRYRKGLSHFLFTLEVRSNRRQIIREALQNLENLRDYSLEIQETVLKCFESAVRSTFGESPFNSDVIVETNGHSAAVCDDGSSTAGSSINEKNRFRTRKPHTTT